MDNNFQGLNLENYLTTLGSSWDGFTTLDLLKELIDNGLDANSKKINIYTDFKSIVYKDNGNGMNKYDLFRLVQFYSTNNSKDTTNGKFGIGGNKAQVALSDLNTTFDNKEIYIVTKKDNEVHSVKIKWYNCKTLYDYEKEINKSYNFNNKKDINLFNCINSGTYIKIRTSDKRIDELNLLNDKDLMNLGITYHDYIRNEKQITICNRDLISYFIDENCNNSCINQLFTINYYTMNNSCYYSVDIDGNTYYLTPSGKGMSKLLEEENNVNTDNLKGYKLCAEFQLRLKFNVDLYNKDFFEKTNKLEKIYYYKKNKFINLDKALELQQIIKNNYQEINNIDSYFKGYPNNFQDFYINKLKNKDNDNIETELDDILKQKLCERFYDYTNKLYIKRQGNDENKRTLGFLNLTSPTNGDLYKRLLFNYIEKILEFEQKVDNILKLVQSNKSKVEWDKTLNKLDRLITLIIRKVIDKIIIPKLKSLDSNKNIINLENNFKIIDEQIELINRKNKEDKKKHKELEKKTINIDTLKVIKIQRAIRKYIYKKKLKNFNNELPKYKLELIDLIHNMKNIINYKTNNEKIINILNNLTQTNNMICKNN